MSTMQRVRQAISQSHDTIEQTDFAKSLMDGRITRPLTGCTCANPRNSCRARAIDRRDFRSCRLLSTDHDSHTCNQSRCDRAGSGSGWHPTLPKPT